ncbi:uncharacterized protein LOC132248816 [Alligator mississippiensis]|uniref:uncharacterized protein LOC132248816 n=1 Tax=Alligator mississippiensis TaxID=8496 RepID=UPI002877EFD2|nr:uncharacterized protein LOC132248816 [Alligator mississippiensis]
MPRMGTCRTPRVPSGSAAPPSGTSETATQTETLVLGSTQTEPLALGCGGCLSLFQALGPGSMATSPCGVCSLLGSLARQLEELQATVQRLRAIRDCEQEIDSYCQALLSREAEGRPRSPSRPKEDSGTSCCVQPGAWTKVVKGPKARRTKAPPPPELSNRYAPLAAPAEPAELPAPTGNMGLTAAPAPALPKTKRKVFIVGDSLLRGTEGPICFPLAREVCCFPGARIRDIAERIPKLLKPTDHYPMLLIHVGTNDTARSTPSQVMRRYRDLGAGLKGLGAQVVFSSILPVSGYGLRRDRRICVVNQRLRRWCRQEGFGFHDHSPLFGKRGSELLGRDGLHLSPLGRRLFSARLADLLHRALN